MAGWQDAPAVDAPKSGGWQSAPAVGDSTRGASTERNLFAEAAGVPYGIELRGGPNEVGQSWGRLKNDLAAAFGPATDAERQRPRTPTGAPASPRLLAGDRIGADLMDLPASLVREYINKPIAAVTGVPADIVGAAELAAGSAMGPRGTTPARAVPRPAVRAPVNDLATLVPPPPPRPVPPLKRAVEPFVARVSPAAAERQAGEVIARRATDLPAVRRSLEPGADEIVAGSVPTTFQQTGDVGLGALEREVATRNPEPFAARRGEQNAARVGALEGVQSGADPLDVAKTFRAHLDELDAVTEAEVTAAQSKGEAAVAGTDAATGAALQTATGAAQARAEAIGGMGTPEGYGDAVRTNLDAANEAAKARTRKLYDAIDPDGSLTGNMSGTNTAAKTIMGEASPTAMPFSADEAAIYKAAAELPDVAPARDLLELNQWVNSALKKANMAGAGPDSARLTRLRSAIQSNLDNTIAERVALDDVAVKSGQMAPEDAIWSRVVGERNAFGGGLQAPEAGRQAGAVPAGNAGGGPRTVRGPAGAAQPPTGRPGAPEGGLGLPSGPELAAAQADVATARSGPSSSLFSAIRDLGGIRVRDEAGFALPGPDVGSALQDVRLAPGVLNNAGGKSPEYMAQALADDGWFGPGVADPAAAFEAALSREARGTKVFHPEATPAASREAALRVDQDLAAAGVLSSDSRMVAARKLADYRSAESEIRRRSEATGVPADQMSREDMIGDIIEREAIQAESGPAPVDPALAEFDRAFATGPQPTFDAAAAARSKAAAASHAERKQTFGIQPIDGVLKTNGMKGQFVLKSGEVPGKFFRPGPGGFQSMQALLKASPESLSVIEDHAAMSARRAAIGDDGVMNPAKYDRWARSHQDALRALPEATRARFKDAASAGEAVADAAAARAEAMKTVQAEALQKVADAVAARKATLTDAQRGPTGRVAPLTEPQDVTRTVGTILEGRTAVADMKALAAGARRDATGNASAGLRQAVADHMLSKLVGNTEAAASGLAQIKADAFQTFVRRNREALSAAGFGPDEMASMEAIAADIQRAKRSENAVKLPGGSNTAQDIIAAARGKPVPGAKGFWSSVLGVVGLGAGGWAVAIPAALGANFIQGLRLAGIERVDQLVTQAMLNPELAKALLAKVPTPTASVVRGRAAAQPALVDTAAVLRALGVTGVAGQASQADARPQPDASNPLASLSAP